MTIKEIRKQMRSMDGHHYTEFILVPGWGQIGKIGKRYCTGPLPEKDDSDIMRDYSAWTYGRTEKAILEDIQRKLKIS